MNRILLLGVSLVLLLSACKTDRYTPYLVDVERGDLKQALKQNDVIILPGDELSITVEAADADAAVSFNHRHAVRVGHKKFTTENDDYLVGEDGCIDYPHLGHIEVMGLTHDSLSHRLSQALSDSGYIDSPAVTVKMTNFRVAVLGEVAKPGFVYPDGWRLTIFEALAMSGDITIHGRRDNVTVVRTQGDSITVAEMDLTSKTVFDSPCYYLLPNDMVYVEPTDQHKRTATLDQNVPKYITIGVTFYSLVRQTMRFARARWRGRW